MVIVQNQINRNRFFDGLARAAIQLLIQYYKSSSLFQEAFQPALYSNVLQYSCTFSDLRKTQNGCKQIEVQFASSFQHVTIQYFNYISLNFFRQ